jgi:hypothetical protein
MRERRPLQRSPRARARYHRASSSSRSLGPLRGESERESGTGSPRAGGRPHGLDETRARGVSARVAEGALWRREGASAHAKPARRGRGLDEELGGGGASFKRRLRRAEDATARSRIGCPQSGALCFPVARTRPIPRNRTCNESSDGHGHGHVGNWKRSVTPKALPPWAAKRDHQKISRRGRRACR